ncbi:hypothetical protein BJP25_23135 [Actinokineospora bangkokensis]|uniref:Uncharacterized protein n=1 Tax=Actinokineospora bangkokensis TaxID=1193682 RepID=A0A1Q9LJR2_9PSEU|nr:hypothetical protein BJP25_23135 [Actinokineospora bangkokensis]
MAEATAVGERRVVGNVLRGSIGNLASVATSDRAGGRGRVLAADRQALRQARDHEQDGRRHADRLKRGFYSSFQYVTLYTFATYSQKFLENTAGIPRRQVTVILFLAILVAAVMQPPAGRLSDVAIFGGTAELIAQALKSAGLEPVFFFYVAGTALVSLVVYTTMRETSRTSQLRGDREG